MITIFKGNEKIVCTKTTFEEQFKHLGYQIASKDKEATKKVASLSNEEIQDKEKKEDVEKDVLTEKYKLDDTPKTKRGKKGK